jgi:hypothetical protein
MEHQFQVVVLVPVDREDLVEEPVAVEHSQVV